MKAVLEFQIHTELILAFALLLCAIVSFALEKVRISVTATFLLFAITILSLVGLPLWPTGKEIMGVFSSEAPLTIIAMFMLSAALARNGIIERLTTRLEALVCCGYHPFLFLFLLLVALFSAFINNTPVVVILLPVAIGLSRSLGVTASKLLIPISYASIFGGCCTLIGTSTNIIASGFMDNSSLYPDMGPMNMFELTKVGLPLLVLGVSYLVLFSRKLLPERESLSKILAEIDRKEFLTEAILLPSSPLLGRTVGEAPVSNADGVRLLEIVRQGKSVSGPIQECVYTAGDRLVLSCKPRGMLEFQEVKGFKFFDQTELGMEEVFSSQAVMVEAMVKPSSRLIGRSVADADFRSLYNLSVVALHRKGKNLKLGTSILKMEAGDTLLLLGAEEGVEKLRESDEAVLLDKPPLFMERKQMKSIITVGVLAAVVATASLGMLALSTASVLGVSCLIMLKCISLREAFKNIEWNIITLIYSMLALGLVMEKSGGSTLLAELIKSVCSNGFSGQWQVIGALVVIYLFTACMTELLSNNATIAIMAPVSLTVAHQFGLDALSAKAFLVTACIAASASFITPIGYQTNTFVYSVGGYRFKDFVKFGLWPMILYFLGTIALVAFYWNLIPTGLAP